LLAVLWQSAWLLGDGDRLAQSPGSKPLTQQKAMKICQDEDFLPSLSIGQIETVLREPV